MSFSFIKPIPTFTYSSYFVSSLGLVVKCNHMINFLDFSFFWQNSSTMEREWGAIMCWMINKRCKTGYWWQLMMHLLRQQYIYHMSSSLSRSKIPKQEVGVKNLSRGICSDACSPNEMRTMVTWIKAIKVVRNRGSVWEMLSHLYLDFMRNS